MLAQLVGQEGLSLGPSAVMTQAAVGLSSPDHNHHRYRRNSYTKSIDNGPAHIEVPSDFAAMAVSMGLSQPCMDLLYCGGRVWLHPFP